MSIQSWKDEFITNTGNLSTDGKNKWIGVRKANLEKHGLIQYGIYLYTAGDDPQHSDTEAVFDLSACGLCTVYAFRSEGCPECPLSLVRGGVSCDYVPPEEETELEYSAPWYVATSALPDPEPMIAWLEKAEQYERTQDGNT